MKMKLPDGRIIDVEPRSITKTNEQWSTYVLDDGTTIRVKPVVTFIARTADYTDEGEPVYQLRWNVIITADVPDNLKKFAS